MCENVDNTTVVNIEKATLYGKMAKVMGRLTRIKESGRHSQGWKYATSEDVKDAVRVAMSEEGLALLVNLKSHEIVTLDKGVLVRGTMEFTICCSETGATVTRQLVGEAADQAKVSDKAFYKLYTTLTKYFLRTTFLISSGEELDSDSDTPRPTSQNNKMTLEKLLANLNKVGRIRGFYGPSSPIMDCRSKGTELPSPDDTDGWRQLFVDARDHAFGQLDRAVEDGKIPPAQIPMSEPEAVGSAMDEVEATEAEEDAQSLIDGGLVDAHGPDVYK